MLLVMGFLTGCGVADESPGPSISNVSDHYEENLNSGDSMPVSSVELKAAATKVAKSDFIEITTPATLAESEAIANLIQAAVAEQDVEAILELFDENQFGARVLAGMQIDSNTRTRFNGGFKTGPLRFLLSQILEEVSGGGGYTFVRTVHSDGSFRPMFRLKTMSYGLNYHEFIVTRDSNSEPRIADVYVYLSGELMSVSQRRIAIPELAADNPDIAKQLSGADSELLKHLPALRKIDALFRKGDFSKSLNAYATLPTELMRNKSLLVAKLTTAGYVSEAEYLKVLHQMELCFPDDPGHDFRSLDLLATQGRHEEALRIIDRLIATIQDSYLNVKKADCLMALNRSEDAYKAVQAAKAGAPDDEKLFWIEISMAVKDKNHSVTARLLDEIATRFGVEFSDLKSIPFYADFVASDEGRSWLAKHVELPLPPGESAASGVKDPSNERNDNP